MPMVVATSLALSSLMGLMASVVIFIQAIKSPDLAGLVLVLFFVALFALTANVSFAAHALSFPMLWAASSSRTCCSV